MVEATSSTALALKPVLESPDKVIRSGDFGMGTYRAIAGTDSLWLEVMIEGKGGFALRAGYLCGNNLLSAESLDDGYSLQFVSGMIRVTVSEEKGVLRVVSTVTPDADLTLPFVPRDFYLIDAEGNALQTDGAVHCVQTGLAAPLVYLSLNKPKVGTFLYFQNLTSLNEYFRATKTVPNEAVGGKWPELGTLLPVSAENPLPAGKEITISDVLIQFSPEIPKDALEMSDMFLTFLGNMYPQLSPADTQRHDWLKLAEKSLKNLSSAPGARVTHWNETYLHPYVDAEYPDSMVHANVLHGLMDYEIWTGKKIPLAAKLQKSISRFYDRELQTTRRYLPNVGKDKDANQVDGWYFMHPLMSLARMAGNDVPWARKQFFDSLDILIKFAHKFKYRWPVFFNLESGEITKAERRDGAPGQTDAAGLYSYVMMQAYGLTKEDRYLEEAKKSLLAVQGLGFELTYQTNITAWGVTAATMVYRETQDPLFLKSASQFLASFFRCTSLWESDIEHAEHYPVFLGALCLDKGPYMAIFECHEAYEALTEALSLVNGDLSDSAKLLMAEYIRFTQDRSWFYFPEHLPKEVIAEKAKNGRNDRKLTFPLEDLYIDGQQAGKIGQEVYGVGAAFAYVTNSYHKTEGADFLIYCEYPIAEKEDQSGSTKFQVLGSPNANADLEILPLPKSRKKVKVEAWVNGEPKGLVDSLSVPGSSAIELKWQ